MAVAALAIAAAGFAGLALAGPANDGFLPPDQAFRVSASAAGPNRVQVNYVIASGYYLYQSRLKFATTSPGVTLGKPELPAGDTKQDEYFGKQIVYHSGFVARLDVTRAASAGNTVALAVTYQGCAEAGLCYPPITKPFTVSLAPKAAAVLGVGAAGAGGAGSRGGKSFVSEQDQQAASILGDHLLKMLAGFFLSGLLVAFTGCVLPTVPILSAIIVGQGNKVTTVKAFLLSLTYVLGMACTYTAAGALTAASGLQVQALFQKAWVVVLFAGLIVAMAASMFGMYTVQMPAFIQSRMTDLSNRQRGGTYGGVAVMGMLSALIITACVAPAMIAALTVISQSGNVARGASALFAMSLGMGTPLLLIGTSAGKLLPRAGAWMDDIKRLGGCVMLGVAAWMLARLVSDRTALLLYSVPALLAAWVLWRFAVRGPGLHVARLAAAASVIYALLLVNGYARGHTDPLHPLQPPAAVATEPQFARVATLTDLDQAVRTAAAQGRAVMLDFYADWCTSCKEMERYTFTNPQVRQALSQLTLLRADVTANNADDQAMLKRFGIFGPPTIAFYGGDGHERANYRVVGYMKADAFAARLQLATAPGG